MKWYMYRNEKGQEIKRNEPSCNELGWDGYKLMRVIDLEVTEKDRKANKSK